MNTIILLAVVIVCIWIATLVIDQICQDRQANKICKVIVYLLALYAVLVLSGILNRVC